jgi:hypothetical protein
MKQTTSINEDGVLKKAQDATLQSLTSFETALGHLADKVENTNRRVEHVGEIVGRLKDEFLHLKSNAQAAIKPLAPLVEQGTKAIRRVRSHPRSLLWVAAGLIGIFWAARVYGERSRLQEASDF